MEGMQRDRRRAVEKCTGGYVKSVHRVYGGVPWMVCRVFVNGAQRDAEGCMKSPQRVCRGTQRDECRVNGRVCTVVCMGCSGWYTQRYAEGIWRVCRGCTMSEQSAWRVCSRVHIQFIERRLWGALKKHAEE